MAQRLLNDLPHIIMLWLSSLGMKPKLNLLMPGLYSFFNALLNKAPSKQCIL